MSRKIDFSAVAKAQIVREIFDEINSLFEKYFEDNRNHKYDPDIVKTLKHSARYTINELWHDISEIEKKYEENEE